MVRDPFQHSEWVKVMTSQGSPYVEILVNCAQMVDYTLRVRRGERDSSLCGDRSQWTSTRRRGNGLHTSAT